VRSGTDGDTYLVLDDLGPLGRAWRETSDESTNRETLLSKIITGDYERPVRIVLFNTAEGWCRDVTDRHRRRNASTLCRNTTRCQFRFWASWMLPKDSRRR